MPRRRLKSITKLDLLKENIDQYKYWQSEIGGKMYKIIDIKERSLKLKEETNRKIDKLIYLKEQALKLKQMEFDANIASKRIDLHWSLKR